MRRHDGLDGARSPEIEGACAGGVGFAVRLDSETESVARPEQNVMPVTL
jgi:hypothetical protein